MQILFETRYSDNNLPAIRMKFNAIIAKESVTAPASSFTRLTCFANGYRSGPISSTSRFASGCGAEHVPGTMLHHPTNHVSGSTEPPGRAAGPEGVISDTILPVTMTGCCGGPLRLAFRSAQQRRWAVVGHPSAEGLWPRSHSDLLNPDASPVTGRHRDFDCEFDGKRLLVQR